MLVKCLDTSTEVQVSDTGTEVQVRVLVKCLDTSTEVSLCRSFTHTGERRRHNGRSALQYQNTLQDKTLYKKTFLL